MDRSYLAKAIKRPEFVQEIKRLYGARISLGITGYQGKLAILLRVEEEHPREDVSYVTIDGERIHVLIKGGFRRSYFLHRAVVGAGVRVCCSCPRRK